MSDSPRVSIIVPVYGVEKFIKEALDSLVNQSLKEIEIIIVDDGSKDACPEIIDEYAKEDKRIIAIHKANEGYGTACNAALAVAKGKYVAIMEPDEFVAKNMYEDLYNLAEANDADVVKSSFYKNILVNGSYKIVEEHVNVPAKYFREVFTIKDVPTLLSIHPSIWSCIYKREFLVNNCIKFVEVPGSGWVDNLFQVQTMCLANRILYTPNAYYYWRVLDAEPSDAIRDYTVPINRSLEVNKWLSDNKYDDTSILGNIYIREFNYITIILGMRNIVDAKNCYDKIKELCASMDKNIVLNSNVITKKYKRLYKLLLLNPKLVRIKICIKSLRRRLCSIVFLNAK